MRSWAIAFALVGLAYVASLAAQDWQAHTIALKCINRGGSIPSVGTCVLPTNVTRL